MGLTALVSNELTMVEVETHVDRVEIVELLKSLVRINSVNPALVERGAGEDEIAERVAEFLRGIGLTPSIEEVRPGRPNVVAILRGLGDGPSLILNGHMDTVGIDYMEMDPLDPIVKEGRLYGRGACDMKGGLAAILGAAQALVGSGTGLLGDLIVAAVCDEEHASIGTERLMERMKADAAIVAEPTGLQIVVAHKGFAWVDVETRGVAAHGSRPDVGVDAISRMGRVLAEIERLQEETLQQRNHELVGSPSIHASTIHGGRELSTYPDHCKLQLERRMIPGETQSDVVTEMRNILTILSGKDPKFQADFRLTFARGPMEVPSTERVCRILHRSAKEAADLTPKFVGSGGWLDTEIIMRHGIPAVAFGPEGEGAHGSIEYVNLDSVIKAAEVLEVAAVLFCGTKP